MRTEVKVRRLMGEGSRGVEDRKKERETAETEREKGKKREGEREAKA